jgi:hypothetical protein
VEQKQELDLVIRETKDGEWYYSLRKPCGEVIREKEATGKHLAFLCGITWAYDAMAGKELTLHVTVEKE